MSNQDLPLMYARYPRIVIIDQETKKLIKNQSFAMSYLVKWFSEESQEGWIDTSAAENLFPKGTWRSYGFDVLTEFMTPYGEVFSYTRKKP